MGIIAALIIGAVAGWLAGLMVRGAGFGLIGNIVVGIIGALLASWLLPQLGVSLGAAVLRATAYLVSLLPAGLGFAAILFDADGRALHDRLAETRVVKA